MSYMSKHEQVRAHLHLTKKTHSPANFDVEEI